MYDENGPPVYRSVRHTTDLLRLPFWPVQNGEDWALHCVAVCASWFVEAAPDAHPAV